jgi:hypothetical protein
MLKILLGIMYLHITLPYGSRQGLGLENFLLKFLDLTIYQEVPKLFSRHELRGQVDKTTSKQLKIQQFETTGFHDRQTAAAAAETSVTATTIPAAS